jgi:hypothetical protein
MARPRTVGVAPGTFTLQLGAPVAIPRMSPTMNPHPPDGNGAGTWGVPKLGWYDEPNNFYGIPDDQAGTLTHQAYSWTDVVPPVTTPQPGQPVLLNPYGTESKLAGVPPTVGGIRLDILGYVVGAVLTIGLAVGFLASK